MSKISQHSNRKWLWLTLIFLVVDQVTKHWVANTMGLYQSIEILPFFNITYAQNTGAAFSFLAEQGGWQRWFFTAIAVIASVIFFVWLLRVPKQQQKLAIALALMLSGALGNLIDRALFGYVIDFLDFHLQGYRWPTFNIADSVIFIGAALMIWDSFSQEKQDKHSAKA